MSTRLDFTFIAEYSANFATRCCDIFYSSFPAVDGKHVLNLTSVKQVNLFAVKALFELWQNEAERFQSNIFDYEAPEVKLAISHLMNLLSKNISIRRENFEPLLREAVMDALIYAAKPDVYFNKFFNRFTRKIPVEKTLMAYSKYYQLHHRLYTAFLAELKEEGPKIKPKKAYRIISSLIEDKPELVESPDAILLSLSEIMQIRKENLFTIAENESSFQQYIGFSPAEGPSGKVNVFEMVDATPSPNLSKEEYDYEDFGEENPKENIYTPATNDTVVASAPTPPPPPVVEQKPQPAPVAPPPAEPVQPPQPVAKNSYADQDLHRETLEEIVPKPTPPKFVAPPEEEEEEAKAPTMLDSIAQKVKQETPVSPPTPAKPLLIKDEDDAEAVVEKAAPENSVYNGLLNQMSKSKQMKGNIPLNLKFKFQNELFGGDHEVFTEAVDLIDQCDNYQQAIALIKDKYVRKYNWDFGMPTTIDFLSLVDGKY